MGQREIKFRAWDKKSKKMREIDMISFHNQHSCFDHDNSNTPKLVTLWGSEMIEQKDICLRREKSDFVLMQFVGRKDKIGKEIYEGDINQNGDWLAYSDAWAKFGWTDGGYIVDIDSNTDEVKGNIYENPDLL